MIIDQRMFDAGFTRTQIACWHSNRIMDRDRTLARNTAVHEAGHVVYAYDQGILIYGVAIIGYSSGDEARGITCYAANDFTARPIDTYCTFCCAGLMAEMELEVSMEATRHLSDADYNRARTMLRCLYAASGLEKMIDRYNALAIQHLRYRRQAVIELAAELEAKRFLDRTEIAAILSRH